MSAISKIQASIASATQETTVALASLNFDFSLWKVEAPAAYHPLGDKLSLQRRTAAENGPPHIIARRLGSLFETLLPKTPSLIHAYGTRASEIAQALAQNSTDSEKVDGPWKRFIGFDGTSIWAAATSGPDAVAVHLLACMLARVWSAAEAVSIWEELVAERRKALIPEPVDGLEQSVPVRDAIASQLAISKEQLAEWDASARAWLQAAETATPVEGSQQALTDFLDDLSLPVGSQSVVYKNVCEAWVTALSTVDKLVEGHPYSAQDGAVVLALSSWHLYPDLIVLGTSVKELHLNDNLIGPGGALTIGLQSSDPSAPEGVRWSLSLAHLRYYGKPVLTHGRLSSDTNRLTFSEFRLVVLGAFIAACGFPIGQFQKGVKLVRTLRAAATKFKDYASGRWRWLDMLDSAAATVPQHTDETTIVNSLENSYKLVRLGHRRRMILTDYNPDETFKVHDYVLSDFASDVDERIRLIRFLFESWDHKKVPLILRIKQHQDVAFATVDPERSGADPQTVQHTLFITGDHHWSLCPDDKRRWYKRGDIDYFDRSPGGRLLWHNPPSQLIPAAAHDHAATDAKALSTTWLSRTFGKRKRRNLVAPIGFNPIWYFGPAITLFCPSNHVFDVEGFQWSLDMMLAAYEAERIDDRGLLEWIQCLADGEISSSCHAIAIASELYESMPTATISPRVLDPSRPISRLKWANLARGDWRVFKGAAVFPCVAYFESGFVDIDPIGSLRQVMAMSSGDSLYIAAPLLGDPASGLGSFGIRRVIGNVGRAGIAFILSPDSPNLRSDTSESWRLVNHAPFDGRLENNFRSTSLHLGFTGYEVPLSVSDHGGRFVESSFVEAVVSVHDSGRWVGDIDILQTLKNGALSLLRKQPGCEHSSPAGTIPEEEIVSFDNWDELLDSPSIPGVVRAHGNWQARLAAACISVSLGHPTVLFGQHGCWPCALKTMQSLKSKETDLDPQATEKHGVYIL